ncbi:MAG: HesB/IscA family protein, partial [Parvibaculales bacterium]
EKALSHCKDILSQQKGEVEGIRLGVKNAGCAGMEYVMEIVCEPSQLDELVEVNGVKMFIDSKSILFLLGTEIDFEESTLSHGFVFHNPNQTDACGCGASVMLHPAQK